MTGTKTLLLALLATSTVGLSGCPGDGTQAAIATRHTANSFASPAQTQNPAVKPRHPASKNPVRESFLSSYNNPEYGISFRYPRYYALEEGEVEEHSFYLKRQEDLDLEQPGAILVATVLIPEDSYPNTTFEFGSLQLFVDESATPETCKEFSSVQQDAYALKNLILHGISFRGTQRRYEVAGTHVVQREYAGFTGETCYQFRLVVAAGTASDPDGVIKAADETRILRQLEKVVGSAEFPEKRTIPEELNTDSTSRL